MQNFNVHFSQVFSVFFFGGQKQVVKSEIKDIKILLDQILNPLLFESDTAH